MLKHHILNSTTLAMRVTNNKKYDDALSDTATKMDAIAEYLNIDSVYMMLFRHPILRLVNAEIAISHAVPFRRSKSKGLSKNANDKRVHNESYNV